MKKPAPKTVNIFLSLEQDIYKGYFNQQDPAPLYKRQLSHDFELYIMNSIRSAKRDAIFNYKISFTNEEDQEYAEPLLYAIRRHFGEAKALSQTTFAKFKRRTYVLLFLSLLVVMICHGWLPLLFNEDQESSLKSGLINSLDVLCWVVLWKPIERLIFYWNPFLKEIAISDKLQKAEAVVASIQK